MSIRSTPCRGKSGFLLDESESPLTDLQGSRQPGSKRSSSAPARSALLVEPILQVAVRADTGTAEGQIRQPTIEHDCGPKRKRSYSPSSSFVAVTTTPQSKIRPATMSPQPASNVEQRAAGFSDGDDGRRKVAGGAYSSKDFAISAREVPPDPDAAQSEHTTHNEPAATPSKRVKSHIAPWMTQRHKNAIRRSLGPATASETPVELSPSQTGAAPKGGAPEGSARDSNLSQDTQP